MVLESTDHLLVRLEGVDRGTRKESGETERSAPVICAAVDNVLHPIGAQEAPCIGKRISVPLQVDIYALERAMNNASQ